MSQLLRRITIASLSRPGIRNAPVVKLLVLMLLRVGTQKMSDPVLSYNSI